MNTVTMIYTFIIISCVQVQISLSKTDNWCPNIVCTNIGKCRPCDKHFLFILAQGRSGSTTLKNMINLLPGIRIGGEIGDTIQKMDDLWSYLSYENDLVKDRGNFEGVYGHNHYPPEYLSCSAQRLITSINPPNEFNNKNNSSVKDDPDSIIGFKELRIDTFNHIEFLLTHFPCSRFIFNVRNDPNSLVKSQQQWLGKGENLTTKSDKVPIIHRYLVQRLGRKRVYFMDMVQWSKGGGKEFNDLAKWLGYNENCIFPGVLKDNVVVKNKWLKDTNRFQLDSSCRLRN